MSGGVNWGRERLNTCNMVNDLSLQPSVGIRASDPRTEDFCDVRPPFLPQVKGQVAYPLPGGVGMSATFQSLSGPELRAQYPLNNAIASPSLGRNFTNVAPTVDVVPLGTLYGDRVYQTDLRFSRIMRVGGAVIRPTMSIYNLFNANPVQTYNNTLGAAWLAPTVILQSRFVDLGLQIDF